MQGNVYNCIVFDHGLSVCYGNLYEHAQVQILRYGDFHLPNKQTSLTFI